MQNTPDDQHDDSSDESEWEFGVDVVDDTEGPDNSDIPNSLESVVGAVQPEADDDPAELPPLEPGSPSLENTVFVLLGIVGTILIFVSL